LTELFPDLPEHRIPETAQPAGAARLRTANRDQTMLSALSLDEMLPADHEARVVVAFVARLDLTPLKTAIKSREGRPGHPAIDPAILVALWLYATLDSIGSARELARQCQMSLPYQWICGGVSVNYHTLADARLACDAWLDQTLARSIAVLADAGAITLETVAQDGMRVRANAGAGSFRRAATLERYLAEAKQRVAALKQELGEATAASRTRKQAAQLRAAREREARVAAALAALPAAEQRVARNKKKPAEARVSMTDAQAQVMKMPDGGFRPAYNTQLAAETQHGLIVGLEISTSGGDQPSLAPMVEQVTQQTGRTPQNWLVDGGYFNREQMTALARAGITPYCPPHETHKGDRDPAQAVKGDTPELAELRARMASEAGQALYRQRARWIEWVNAGYRARDWGQVLLRGLVKVRTKARWQALAHNMTRIVRSEVLNAAFPARLRLA
jgi:transposase